jgi:FkbM family methyltransferase
MRLCRDLRLRSLPSLAIVLLLARVRKISSGKGQLRLFFRPKNGVHYPPLVLRFSGSDAEVFLEVFLKRHYEDALNHVHGGVVVDLGANFGGAGYFFALNSNASQIVSVEPNPENLELLRQNARQFPGRWVVLPLAVGRLNDPRPFYWSGWQGSGTCIASIAEARSSDSARPEARSRKKPILVEGVTMERLLSAYVAVDVCKIDVEGAESEIFSEQLRQGSLACVKYICIEVHGKYIASEKVYQCLNAQGFEYLRRSDAKSDLLYVNRKCNRDGIR